MSSVPSYWTSRSGCSRCWLKKCCLGSCRVTGASAAWKRRSANCLIGSAWRTGRWRSRPTTSGPASWCGSRSSFRSWRTGRVQTRGCTVRLGGRSTVSRRSLDRCSSGRSHRPTSSSRCGACLASGVRARTRRSSATHVTCVKVRNWGSTCFRCYCGSTTSWTMTSSSRTSMSRARS